MSRELREANVVGDRRSGGRIAGYEGYTERFSQLKERLVVAYMGGGLEPSSGVNEDISQIMS